MTDRSSVDISIYKATLNVGASKFKQILWYIINIIFFKNPFNILSSSKVFLLKAFGARVGEGVVIKPAVNIKYPWKLAIGDYSWVGEEVWIDNLEYISIGDNVCLSQGCMLLTGNHDYTKKSFDLVVKGIVLENGVWIGAKAIVCPGTICESHSVLSVHSVASRRLEAYRIYQGNPALPIKSRNINF